MGREHPALEYMEAALRGGKNVVTANKDVVATHGKELFELAAAHHVDFLFEAAVAGGIPIIRPLKESLAANRISKIMGIINGTTNYMLTKMTQEHMDFAEVLKEAQDKGYAESDPTADVGGFDAARKSPSWPPLPSTAGWGWTMCTWKASTRSLPGTLNMPMNWAM